MENKLFIIFLIVHLLTTIIYFVVIKKKTDSNTQAFSESVIVLFMPIAGLLFLLGAKMLMAFDKRSKESVNIYHQYKDDRLVLGEHMQYEDDILPLNDALMIDDSIQKRDLLTDAIKRDVLSNHQVLKKAIKDSDREISHYAVSFVTTKIEKLEADLYRLEKNIQEDSQNVDYLKDYIENMREYLSIGFLDKVSRTRNEKLYMDALTKIINLSPDEKHLFIYKIDHSIAVDEIEKAKQYCALFLEKFPLSEDPYLMFIKLYQKTKESDKLQETIKTLKKSPIKLTATALNTIRFWDQEGNYV